MDTSKEYIKMCQEAKEIQSQRPDLMGHHYRFDKHMHILKGDYYFWEIGNRDITGKVWLPRQDQLQEIVRNDYKGLLDFFTAFNCFFREDIIDIHTLDDMSMEQLWLAFVMKEKHGKIWTGSEWEEEKKKKPKESS